MASDYRSFYVEQTHLLFLLHFRSRHFREHRIQKLRQKFAVFNLVVSHTEHRLRSFVGQLLFRVRQQLKRRRHGLHQKAVIVNPAEDFPVGIEDVFAHHLAGGHTETTFNQFSVELFQNVVTKLL